MTSEPDALIVLLDAEDLRATFPDWPGILCLAVCLMRNGDFSTLLFRRKERMEVPAHVIELNSLDASRVCFVPKVPGFATRSFLYSDERRLMALLASNQSILDEATDYLINYTYAIEEGLDPAMILGQPFWAANADTEVPQSAKKQAVVRAVRQQSQRPVDPPIPSKPELSPILPDFLRKSAEQRRPFRFSTVRTIGIDALAASH